LLPADRMMLSERFAFLDGADISRVGGGRNGRRLSHIVANDLRRRIVRGELPPGQALPSEAALMKALSVSRDSLREALRILESETLVYIRRGPHGGAVVRQADLGALARYVALVLQTKAITVEQLYEAKRTLESPAMRLLGENRGTSTLPAVDELEVTGVLPGGPLRAVSAIQGFDQKVVELAGNKTLGVLAAVLRDVYGAALYSAMLAAPDAGVRLVARLLERQSEIIEGLRGDAGTVLSSWERYLNESFDLIGKVLRPRATIDIGPYWRAESSAVQREVRSSKMASAIAMELRARYAEGALRSGDRLGMLPELAEEFGVSRPTLREALRTLERESLLELRPGASGGARLLDPSIVVAAQLAGVLLESRQTTFGDVWEARTVLEPKLMRLVARSITRDSLEKLVALERQLGEAVADTPLFTKLWADAEITALSGTGNPALTVASEVLQWVREATQSKLTASAVTLPWVERSNRRAQSRLAEFTGAASKSDGDSAEMVWTRYLSFTTPFFDSFGDRLILDLLE
jgi:DNA-binding FadR family transcriptional regulator